jgi:hypothetical protein
VITLFVAAVVVAKNNNNYPYFIAVLMFCALLFTANHITRPFNQLCRQWSLACAPFKTLALKMRRI